jgi:1,4-dihydroxy-2-naphthoyl-CoA hydrolase
VSFGSDGSSASGAFDVSGGSRGFGVSGGSGSSRELRGSGGSGAPWELAELPSPLIPVERTFEGFLDLQWLSLSGDTAHVRFRVREDLKQPLGLLHGGIYCAVAESVASVATVGAVWKDGMSGSGLSNSASFLRPLTAGVVDVLAQLRGHDEREWLWGHEFRDEQGRLCALVDVTIAVRKLQTS